jgi:hypothetical protein
VREAGGGGLAQQGGDDAPDARQVIASGGAGPLAVGAAWRPAALVAVAGVFVLALMVAPGRSEPGRWRRCSCDCERQSWPPPRCPLLLWRWPALVRWRAR